MKTKIDDEVGVLYVESKILKKGIIFHEVMQRLR